MGEHQGQETEATQQAVQQQSVQPQGTGSQPRENASEQPGSRRRFPGVLWILGLGGLLIAGLVALHLGYESLVERLPILDSAVLVLLTGLGLVTLFTMLAGWWVFVTRTPLAGRVFVAALWIFAMVGLPLLIDPEFNADFRIVSWRWRWEPTRDAQLGLPTIEAQDSVDFSRVDANLLSREREPAAEAPAASTASNFPQFLGPRRDGTLPGPRFARDWQASPPQQLWKQEIGAGWSGFAAAEGYAVTMEQRGDEELTTCYDVETGELMWVHRDTTRHETVPGGIGPRATPTIHRGRVYAHGANGMFSCLDDGTGEVVWQKDLLEEVGTTLSAQAGLVSWGRSGSPVIYDDLVIIPGGGEKPKFASLIAYDAETGEERWRAGETQISYTSPTVMTLLGKEQIVCINEDEIAGYDPQDGAELWNYPREGYSNAGSNTSQPIRLDAESLVMTKGYGLGAERILLKRADDEQISAERVWQNRRVLKTKFTNAVAAGNYLYGLSDGILECVDATNGKSQWRDGRFGHGQLLLVGDGLLILGENGVLHYVAANPERFEPWTEFEAIEGVTWNTLCLYGDLALLRNGQMAGCWQLPTTPAVQQTAAATEALTRTE